MIGTSIPEYIFIRACISSLHWIIPLLALCLVLASISYSQSCRIPVFVEVWAFAEVLFYLLVFLPRRAILQRPALHPPLAPRQRRRHLVDLCHKSGKNPERYLSKWFGGAPLSEIKRDNLKDFYAWAFLNKGAHGLLDDPELEEYVDLFQSGLGRKLEPGRGTAVPLRLTLDKVDMLHRPLVWYLVVRGMFSLASLSPYGSSS